MKPHELAVTMWAFPKSYFRPQVKTHLAMLSQAQRAAESLQPKGLAKLTWAVSRSESRDVHITPELKAALTERVKAVAVSQTGEANVEKKITCEVASQMLFGLAKLKCHPGQEAIKCLLAPFNAEGASCSRGVAADGAWAIAELNMLGALPPSIATTLALPLDKDNKVLTQQRTHSARGGGAKEDMKKYVACLAC